MLDINNLDNWYSIYQHIFPDGKMYFGMTKSYPPTRWGKNGNGYRVNREMTEAIQKYGWDNVEHRILARNLTYEEATDLEANLIIKHKTYDLEHGYNDFIGTKRGQRSLEKQSISQTGKKRIVTEKQRDQLNRLHAYVRELNRIKREGERVNVV